MIVRRAHYVNLDKRTDSGHFPPDPKLVCPSHLDQPRGKLPCLQIEQILEFSVQPPILLVGH